MQTAVMGAVRLLLALAVVFGHAQSFGFIPVDKPYFGYFPVTATLAVQMFFVISGFYMSLVLTGRYATASEFYKSRALRILPPYLVILICAFLFVPGVPPLPSVTSIKSGLFNFSNLTLVGAETPSFYELSGVPAQTQMPLPQAWSLGIELWFYILVPVLAVLRSRQLAAIALVLLAVRVGIGGNVSELWLQRFFPLELYFFLIGMLAHRAYVVTPAVPRSIGIGSVVVACCVVSFVHNYPYLGGWTPARSLILTGLLAVLLPPIFSCTRRSLIDRSIGNLSYPIYLVHYSVMQACASFTLPVVLAAVAVAGCALYALEAPFDRLRVRWVTARSEFPRGSDRQHALPRSRLSRSG